MPEESTALETQETEQSANVPQGTGAPESQSADGSRTYTQEEFEAALEAAVRERTAGAVRERVDRANKQKKELSSENKELSEQVRSLTAQLEELQEKERLREAARKVSEETGVPAELLRGVNEEEMAAHAQALAAYMERPSAPFVGSDGFAASSEEHGQSVQQKFADTIDSLLGR